MRESEAESSMNVNLVNEGDDGESEAESSMNVNLVNEGDDPPLGDHMT